jgi:hypothetical protein
VTGEHVFTHNPAGAVVAHASIGDDLPLCGFASDADTIGGTVTCGDCLAAQGMPGCPRCGAAWFGLRDAAGRKVCGECSRHFPAGAL